MKEVRVILLFFSVVSLLACESKLEVISYSGKAGTEEAVVEVVEEVEEDDGEIIAIEVSDDFLKSYFETGNPAVLGKKAFEFNLFLENSDGSVIAGFTPELKVLYGTGVSNLKCLASDKNGLSKCSVICESKGIISVVSVNLPHIISVKLEFIEAVESFADSTKATKVSIPVQTSTTNGAYRVKSTISHTTSYVSGQTSGGYNVTFGQFDESSD